MKKQDNPHAIGLRAPLIKNNEVRKALRYGLKSNTVDHDLVKINATVVKDCCFKVFYCLLI